MPLLKENPRGGQVIGSVVNMFRPFRHTLSRLVSDIPTSRYAGTVPSER